MKKLQKRFMSLIMASAISVSLSTVAFAAEAGENNNTAIAQVLTEQNAIEPMSANTHIVNLTKHYFGNKRTTVNLQINVPDGGGYVYFGFMGAASAKVTMYKNGVQVSRIYVSKGGQGEIQWNPMLVDGSLRDHYWAGGSYNVKVEIPFDGDYSFCFIATDSAI